MNKQEPKPAPTRWFYSWNTEATPLRWQVKVGMATGSLRHPVMRATPKDKP